MSFYILEKQSKKSYGPFDTKLDAEQELGRVLEMVGKASVEALTGVKVSITEQLDEWVVSTKGQTVAKYEVVSADQFDHPEQIPEEFQ